MEREQNKFGTWRTEQFWNTENRTNSEHGEQNKFGTWRTEQENRKSRNMRNESLNMENRIK